MTSAVQTTEFGPSTSQETDAVLHIMCDAFGMEVEEARPIFYSDPYFELENKYVLRRAGEPVSCLTVVDRQCWVGEAVVRVAGIAGVATKPECRRRGYAAQLLTDTLSALNSRSFHFAALFPTDAAYYGRLGWESAGALHPARCSPSELTRRTGHGAPALSRPRIERPAMPFRQEDDDNSGAMPKPSSTVRKAAIEDLSRVSQIYERAARGRSMYCLRDAKRWRYLLQCLPESYVAVGEDGEIQGYLLSDHRTSAAAATSAGTGSEVKTVLRVLEMHCATEGAAAELRDALARSSTAQTVEFAAPPDILRANGFPVPAAAPASLMVRVVDWRALLQALAANWQEFEGEVGLALVDTPQAAGPGVVVVRGFGTRCEVMPAAAADLATRFPHFLVGAVQAWSTVTVGGMSAEEACAGGLIRGSSARAVELAARLFPARGPFLPAADHF